LNVEGVKASLLYAEFGFTIPTEVEEVFHILQRGGYFYYREYILEMNPTLRHLFFQRSMTPVRSETTLRTQVKDEGSLNESRASISVQSTYVEDPKLRIIKNKLKIYIQTQDINLSSLFRLIDTDSDQVLTLSEFMHKMKAL
jgi:hypothetical protein